MSFPAYPAYKDSTISWLGRVPSHWNVLRLKHACEVFPSNVDKHARDDEPPVRLCNYTDVYYNERITADMPFMEATASEEQIARFTLRGGDTIITKDSETADDIAVAAYVPDDLPGVVCGYHLSMVRPRGSTCGAFVKRLFDSIYAKARFAVAANGLTRVGLGQYAVDNIDLPFPPVDEQRAIAAFLDRETTKIDALVEEQKRLIELLKEKRQAVISQAVTKGLDPSVPMKDSGVAWLGEVPANWEVRRVNSISTKITNGYVGPTRDILVDQGVRYLQSLHIKANRIKFDTPYFVTEDWSKEHRKSILQVGDLLIVQTGDIGQAAVVTDEFAGCNCHALIVVSPLRKVVAGEYLGWVFGSDYGKHSLLSIQTGALHPHLNCGNVKDLVVPLPPPIEQAEILKRCYEAASSFDALIAEAQAAVELLSERRSALISAAVTGKIDVRGLAPQPEVTAA
jgi:type I restriction enzyme S subunit